MSDEKRRTIYFGPPGTGKTTKLMRVLRHHIEEGVDPSRIAFLSFSRRAIAEAKERVKEITDAPLPHFRTIHATAFHMLELSRAQVIQHDRLVEFGSMVGLEFSNPSDEVEDEERLWFGKDGDQCMALIGLARARQTSLRAEWERADSHLPWPLLTRTAQAYDQFRKETGLFDFADMIERAEGELDVDILVVDEAQDSSRAQWALLKRIAGHVRIVYFAGDDDQAVYEWGGADPLQLLRFIGTREILPHSWRLPENILQLANRIAKRIHQRVAKEFTAREGDAGEVNWITDVASLDLHSPGTWLLLARSNFQLGEYRRLARQQGVVYSLSNGEWSTSLPCVRAALAYERLRRNESVTRREARAVLGHIVSPRPLCGGKDMYNWEDVLGPETPRERPWMEALTAMSLADREYIRALRRSGESLTQKGRVQIGTVHSAKGAEADHVVLMTDISERTMEASRVDPDAECRVLYVGVTRAKKKLTLVQPATPNFWDI